MTLKGEFKIENRNIRVLEAFSGIGTQRMALRNLGIPHEVVAISEIDKFAINSYQAIHGETLNLGDIEQVRVEDIPDHDLFTYSFPCQAISVAGKQKGLEEGSGTTSSLLWECQKVIEGKMPKYLLMENVKNLVGKKFKPFFDEWLDYLEGLGYTNYWKVLNSRDFGVAQNRERVFVVSILGEHEPYVFPEPQELTVRLKDILETNVDEKFYLKSEQTKRLVQNSNYLQGAIETPKINILAHRKSYRRNTQVFDPNGLTETLDTGQGGGRGHYTIDLPAIGASRGRNPENPSDRTVGAPTEQRLEINTRGISNTLTTVQKDNYVIESIATDKIIRVGNVNPSGRGMNGEVVSDKGISPTLTTNKGEGGKVMISNEDGSSEFLIGSTQKNAGVTDGTYSTTLTASMGTGGGHVPMHNLTENYRIRKLTPLECFRLMGVCDDDFYKAEEVNSNSQLYKQAGNAIVVNVLEGIFGELFSATKNKH